MTIQGFLIEQDPTQRIWFSGGIAAHAHWANAVVQIYLGTDVNLIAFAQRILEDFIQNSEGA